MEAPAPDDGVPLVAAAALPDGADDGEDIVLPTQAELPPPPDDDDAELGDLAQPLLPPAPRTRLQRIMIGALVTGAVACVFCTVMVLIIGAECFFDRFENEQLADAPRICAW